MIDTAFDYHNQDGVGKAIADSGKARESIFLETKVPGCGLDKAVRVFKCYDDTKAALEQNLQLLNQSYVDLVIIHFPPVGAMVTRTCSPVCSEVRNQWKALEEFYAAGKAKAIGVSNYCASCFKCLDGFATVFPMVNQVQYHIGMGPDPSGFKSEAEKRGVVLQGYSVLGNKPWRQGPDPDILSGKFTTGLAKAHNKSTVEVALKYVVKQGVPAVTKSSNPAHLASDLDLWSWDFTAEELEAANQYKNSGSPSFSCNFAAQESVLV
eukprot:SRR837773.1231.p1 GENE.SRR837773.1231~~SRR837773.1231.p1  ORF type:complete len:294 (-),score=143.31 SRR837773.1231:74-871(-)